MGNVTSAISISTLDSSSPFVREKACTVGFTSGGKQNVLEASI
jgi:hypothetical protein